MPKLRIASAMFVLLATAVLFTAAGCSKHNNGSARWLQRGEAEKLMAARSAEPEKDPDLDQLKNQPTHLEAKADLLASQGAPWPALHSYRRALKSVEGGGEEPDAKLDPVAQERIKGKIAGLYVRLGLYQQARDEFSLLCAKDPKKAVYWQGLGLARLGLGDEAGARQALQKAVILDPSLWRAQNLLGVIHNRNQQHAQAKQAFSHALSARPNEPALHNNMALAMMMSGQYHQAETHLRRALALDPGYNLAAGNLGLALAAQGRTQDAYGVFARAFGPAQAHNNMGCILAWQGRHQQARQHFDQAMKKLPRYYPLAARHLEQTTGAGMAWQPINKAKFKYPERAKAAPKSAPRMATKPQKAVASPRASSAVKPKAKPQPAKILHKAAAAQQAPARPAIKTAPSKPSDSGGGVTPLQQAPPKKQEPKVPAKMEDKRHATVAVVSQKQLPAAQNASGQSAKPAGLWLKADGSMQFGSAKGEPGAMGVVFGAPPSQR